MSRKGAKPWPPVPSRAEPPQGSRIDYPSFARAYRSGPILVRPADVTVRLLHPTSKVLTERPRVEVMHRPTGRVVRMDIGSTYRDAIANALQVLNAHLVIESGPNSFSAQLTV